MGQWSLNLSDTVFGAQSSILGGYSYKDGKSVRLRSVRGVDLSNLVLTDVDLSGCTFAGSYHLEQLRIEGVVTFGRPRGWWRTDRQIVADEAWAGPERVAAIYRALRKSLEDSKFEAGAGDFYYGEMMARQKSTSSRWTERVILWFYWLLSGYGQRAGRALLALLVVIGVVTTVLAIWDRPFGEALRLALGAVAFRDNRENLSGVGNWTVSIARFVGPVLLALAVLAVRARVKR